VVAQQVIFLATGGTVTIATNMAGRGTKDDQNLLQPESKEDTGGLGYHLRTERLTKSTDRLSIRIS